MLKYYGKIKKLPLFNQIKKHFPAFFLISLISAVSSLFIIFVPWATKNIIDQIDKAFQWREYIFTLLILFSAILLRSILSGISSVLTTKIQAKILKIFLEEIHNNLMKMPYHKLIDFHSGQLSAHTMNDANTLIGGFGAGINSLIRYPVEIISLLGVLVYIDIRLLIVIFLMATFVISISKVKSNFISRIFLKQTKTKANLFGTINENITLHKLILMFNNISHRMEIFKRRGNKFYQSQIEYSIKSFKVKLIIELVMGVIMIVGLIFLGSLIANNHLTAGQLAASLAALLSMYNSLKSLSSAWINFQSAMKSGYYLENLVSETENSYCKKDYPYVIENEVNLIEFKEIQFSYNTQEILKHANINLEQGKITILKGDNGVGKSTIIDMLFGIIKNYNGSILINGKDLKKIDPDEVNKKFAIVPQNIELFNESIEYNIKFGKLDADIKVLQNSINKTGVMKFLRKNGIDIKDRVGDNGSKLSLGERQRISIARAMVREPDVLILDEATNNLDQHSIEGILNMISDYSVNHIVLIVTHVDLKLNCNSITYRLKEGVIEEMDK